MWEGETDEESEYLSFTASDRQVSVGAPASLKLIGFIITFLLSWQAVFRIPDNAMNILFRFFKMLISKLCIIASNEELNILHQHFPNSLTVAQKFQSMDHITFKEFIVCQKCCSTYKYEECFGTQGIDTCTYVKFPRHPQKRMKKPCGSPLVKMIKTFSDKKKSIPIKIFNYISITESLKKLVLRPGLLNVLNRWKDRIIPPGVMADIYDGNVWKLFLTLNGKECLSGRYTFGLLINIDWFQPYRHAQYSVGAIYIAILNFPRNLRYRRENMLLIGIIPGPHESKLHINPFLKPLVEELLKLWNGIEMVTTEGNQLIRAVLLCHSSDIPATRKMGGFVGHGALKGCSRCLKSFVTRSFTEKPDYSGFDCENWPNRSMNDHRRKGFEWKHAKTQAEHQKIEREYGVRFTELLRLPYFDCARFSVVDPMHNILLGTAKLMITIWKEKSIISNQNLDRIQSQVDRFVTPPDVGRIPHKISSGFSTFTADQFKNWTLVYSLIVLKPVLPEADLLCWYIFFQACQLLCSRAISYDNALKLNDLLIRFCKMFEELYGKISCTPNLHLHCHLKDWTVLLIMVRQVLFGSLRVNV